MVTRISVLKLIAAASSAALLSACSGGGGGGGSSSPAPSVSPSPTPTPTPTGSSGPTWTQGVFEAASIFKDQCAAPRSGVDIEGNAFPDEPGSLIEELFWLRSWTEETYLWNDDVVDRNPANFNNRLDYFSLLKSNEVTASGEDLDDFHFSQPTEEYLEQRTSAPSASYGFSVVAFSTSPPRDYRIRYTQAETPASDIVNGIPNLVRGTRILSIDGVDLVNGGNSQAEIDTLNNGLFPLTAGETHTFEVQDPFSSTRRTISMTSEDISTAAVNRVRTLDTASGKVGYVLFNTFSTFASEQEIAEAISTLKSENVTDLVLDLRYNGGGLLAVASQLAYMIAGDAQTSGKTFELLQFNEDAGNRNPVTGEFNEPIPFYDTGLGFSLANGAPLESLDLERVFILSTGRTCSASEAVLNGLRGIDIEIVLIGSVTCGKPYGFYPTDNCGETYYTIQFRGVNDKGFGDYSDGFVPGNSTFQFGERVSGCVVSDDYNNELGDPNEALLSAAIEYRDTGTCPTIQVSASAKPAFESAESGAVVTTREPLVEQIRKNNRDLTMPF